MSRKHEIPAPKKSMKPRGKTRAPRPFVPPRPPIRSQPASPAPMRRGR